MKHEIILAMLNLLLATVRCQDSYREVNLIKRLNDYFGFDHNIFFLYTSIDHSRYIPVNRYYDGSFTPQTIFDHNLDNINKTHPPILKSVTSKNTFLIIFVAESSKFENDKKMLAQVKSIRQLNVKIGVFFLRQQRHLNGHRRTIVSMELECRNCEYFLHILLKC